MAKVASKAEDGKGKLAQRRAEWASGRLEATPEEREAAALELQRQYEANAPGESEPRAADLKLAHDLLGEVYECIHALRVNHGADSAGERVHRAWSAIHGASDEAHVALALDVRALWRLRRFALKTLGASHLPNAIEVLRRDQRCEGWRDAQVTRAVRAVHFDVAVAEILRELPQPYRRFVSAKYIEALRRGRSKRKK
ncbi:MAG TPA: hypothetical protein VGG39_24885 [Polyangiaceae bacterium]|jgi:hypothetical protein